VYYFTYNLLLTIACAASLPLLPLWLILRPRFRPGLRERFAWYATNKLRPLLGARPIWIHAASVGEVVAARTLISALKARLPERKILLSTFTDTGNEMAQRSAGADTVIFLPLDHPFFVRRALCKIEPSMVVVIETELWPNLLQQACKRGIPVVLLSGRISEKAFNRYARFIGLFRRVTRCFAAYGMQSHEDARRVARLGADASRIVVTGNLKQGAAVPSITGATEDKPPLMVAGSTHAGEEALLLESFLDLKRRFPGLRLALAPRHPERFTEVEKLLLQAGVSYVKKSRMDASSRTEHDVLLVDTLGDLAEIYALADITFVGGSLVNVGGHNLLEPARLKKPIMFGPFMTNFRSLAEEMKRGGGAIEVRDALELRREAEQLLSDPIKRLRLGENAYRVALLDGAVMDRSLALLSRYVDFALPRALPGFKDGIRAS
jgi:3-deoxy-D-manno-octulosonic-acid transferase